MPKATGLDPPITVFNPVGWFDSYDNDTVFKPGVISSDGLVDGIRCVKDGVSTHVPIRPGKLLELERNILKSSHYFDRCHSARELHNIGLDIPVVHMELVHAAKR